MSRTLNLIDILLTSGRNLFSLGRYRDALIPLNKLAGFRDLDADALCELNSLRGRIFLELEQYRQARRCFAAAIAARPGSGEHHFHMAQAIEDDVDADLERAEGHYTLAVALVPERADFWCEFGSYLFAIGKAAKGLNAIRKAFERGIADSDIVGRVVEMLREEGYAAEATSKLRSALFHNRGAAAFRELWQQHQFELARMDAEKRRRAANGWPAEPVILDFPPPGTP